MRLCFFFQFKDEHEMIKNMISVNDLLYVFLTMQIIAQKLMYLKAFVLDCKKD